MPRSSGHFFMVTFAIVVRGNPLTGQGAWAALRFCEAAIAAGHGISRVFFHGDGTECANANRVFPQDEADPLQRWRQLHETAGITPVVCVTSALKRGVLDAREARRNNRLETLAPFMEIGGLGQLIEATATADKVVCFHDG
jgi:tRNA 2-thiouridine synthesizing protein D